MKHFLQSATLFFFLQSLTNLLRAEDISTAGWRLWPDREAVWQNDRLYLPLEVKPGEMPANPPTDGWQALNDQQGIPVTLPSTVEEHYLGKFGTRTLLER
jgi:hypothetical protein